MSTTRTVSRWMASHGGSGSDYVMQPEPLTPREQQAADLVADGLELKEVARELGIGYQTTKSYLRYARHKLGARNQIELALIMHGHTPRCLRSA